jgi:hypothetical protein
MGLIFPHFHVKEYLRGNSKADNMEPFPGSFFNSTLCFYAFLKPYNKCVIYILLPLVMGFRYRRGPQPVS